MSDKLSADLASLRIDRGARPAASGAPRRFGRWLAGLTVVGGLVVVGVWGYPMLAARVFKTEVALSQVSEVSPIQGSVQVTSTGYVVAQTASEVGPKVAGRIAKTHVVEGQRVAAGELIAELDDVAQKSAIVTAQSRVGAAAANVNVARANLEEVRGQIARQAELVRQGAEPRSLLEDLEARARSLQAAVRAAESNVVAAQAEVANLQVLLGELVVRAPIAGTIIGRPADPGELVGPGAPVAEISDFKTLVVETDVPESRLGAVKPGAPCEIVLDAYPSKHYRGEALSIGRRVNRAKATVPVKVKFVDAMDDVLPDMAARVSFLTEALAPDAEKEPSKRVVPASAVVTRDGVSVVFVAADGKAKLQPVTVGATLGSGVELVDGPSAGTRVVASPPADMRDGQPIKQKEPE